MPASAIPRRFTPNVSDGDKGDITVSASGATWTIDANAVSNDKIRQSSGLSLLGRSANTTGDIADITAANDGGVLRRSGTDIGFGTIATAGIADDAVTYAKMQNVSATQRVLGRSTAGAGNTEEVTAPTVLSWIGNTRGQILFRGSSAWRVLSPGTAGQVLQTGGAGADPSWVAAPGSPFAADISANGVSVGRGGGGIASNTRVGASALNGNTSGTANTAFGTQAVETASTANGNTGIGYFALRVQTGSWSTAVGYNALGSATGSDNVGVGASVGPSLTSGTKNTFVGANTGGGIITGSRNTIVGASVSGLSSSLDNNIIIADGDGNRRINVDASGRVGIGTNTPSTAAMLDVTSTAGGILFPRMTGTQRDAISSPPDGLVLYNTTTNKLQVRAASAWVDLH